MIIEKELSDKIVDCAFEVHKTLGYGFLKKVYENSFVVELKLKGLRPLSQFDILFITVIRLLVIIKLISSQMRKLCLS